MTQRKGNGRFLSNLEKAVEAVLNDDRASPADRVKAIEAGARLLAIKHKVGGSDEKSYFDEH
jgi:hypothetical protein